MSIHGAANRFNFLRPHPHSRFLSARPLHTSAQTRIHPHPFVSKPVTGSLANTTQT